MKKVLFVSLMLMAGLWSRAVYSQNYKYPLNIKYKYGFIPKTFTTANFDKWYKSYKASSLLPECNGGIRTACENASETKVESMGWATIIAAYMGDKTTYDGLMKFYNSKLEGSGGMSWHVTCTGVRQGGTAADGDLDVAYGAVVASWQWGGSYTDNAKKLINNCKKLIANCSGTSVIMGGYGYGGCNETDMSYHTPAFFRCFAEFTNDQAWSKLADDSYTLLNNGANKNTGLVPDWQSLSGGQASGGRNHSYGFDACRVPWRVALDYLWNGNEKAKTWCTTISNWANKIGPANIKDGYNLDGSSTGRYHNMSYVGGFAVAAMCNSQEVADAFGAEVARMNFDNYWYHGFLGNCYMLAMTGNMWNKKMADNNVPEVARRGIETLKNGGAITIKNISKQEFSITGLTIGNTVDLMTLHGQLVKQVSAGTKSDIIMDISSIKSGCYILAVRDTKNTLCKRQIVSLF
ncbi:MAG TPA: glycosyl hydrolase family 8 [Chitinispirillaceae bacterium]|nr:glycosyl hydrolase family 8 [Chitinispirillaceae bacterium]